MVKKSHVLALIIILTQLLFLVFKSKLGAFTPDEILFTTGVYSKGEIVHDELVLRFYLTYRIISFLYKINIYLFPVLQITFGVIIFIYIYKKNRKYKVVKQGSLLLLFLLPSSLYFSSAFLRDYLIFLMSIVLLFEYKINGLKLKTIVFFILLTILRTEAGIIVLFAYLIANINNNTRLGLFRINKLSVIYILPLLLAVLLLFINIDIIWDFLYERFTRADKSYFGFSIWQVDPTKTNIIVVSIFHWFAYYAPFLFKESYSLFSYFMLLDSIIVGSLFIKALLNLKIMNYYNDFVYRVSYIIFLGTFYISILDVTAETMYRHRMAYLPFLFYLCFSIKYSKASDKIK